MARDRLGRLPWLLPPAYVAHVAEEYWGGFPAWLNRTVGASLTEERFLEFNAFLLLGMVAAVVAARAVRPLRGLLVTVATVVVLNAGLHVGGTVVTGRYSPGAITAVLLWAPLGTAILRGLWRELPRLVFLPAVLVGAGLHAMVSLAVVR